MFIIDGCIKFLKVLLFLFILTPLYVFVGLSILAFPCLIAGFIILAITGCSADNIFVTIFGTIIGLTASALFYSKTNLGRKILDYLLELFGEFDNLFRE